MADKVQVDDNQIHMFLNRQASAKVLGLEPQFIRCFLEGARIDNATLNTVIPEAARSVNEIYKKLL